MLGDFNAWIHYAAKRYYAMMGDGQRGAGSSGVITKRGYVMAHFAKYVTGMTRIDASFSGGSLEGSAYLSQTGDTSVVVIPLRSTPVMKRPAVRWSPFLPRVSAPSSPSAHATASRPT